MFNLADCKKIGLLWPYPIVCARELGRLSGTCINFPIFPSAEALGQVWSPLRGWIRGLSRLRPEQRRPGKFRLFGRTLRAETGLHPLEMDSRHGAADADSFGERWRPCSAFYDQATGDRSSGATGLQKCASGSAHSAVARPIPSPARCNRPFRSSGRLRATDIDPVSARVRGRRTGGEVRDCG